MKMPPGSFRKNFVSLTNNSLSGLLGGILDFLLQTSKSGRTETTAPGLCFTYRGCLAASRGGFVLRTALR